MTLPGELRLFPSERQDAQSDRWVVVCLLCRKKLAFTRPNGWVSREARNNDAMSWLMKVPVWKQASGWHCPACTPLKVAP